MRFFLLSGIIVFSLSVHATITVQSVSGASYYNLTPTSSGSATTTPQIYGGAAGIGIGAGTLNADGTYNTCNQTSLAACNQKAISPTTNLTITFTSSTATGIAALCDGSSQIGNSISYTAGTTGTLQIPWSTICSASSFVCSNANPGVVSATLNLYIGSTACASPTDQLAFSFKYSNFDNNSGSPGNSFATTTDGISDFTVFPGDQKAYLDSVTGPSGGSSLSSTYNITAIDAFYVDGTTSGLAVDQTHACDTTIIGTAPGTGGAFSNSLSFFSLPLDSSGNIVDRRINDLINGDVYTFLLAVQDDTGNIGFFTQMYNSAAPGAPAFNCDYTKHAVIPQEVYGLLEKNACFIATAAYGSPFQKKVMLFKKFRDQILLHHKWGREFVRLYYTYSPQYADMIKKSPVARAVVRTFLWPLWLMSAIVLNYGWKVLILLLSSLVFSVILIKKRFLKAKHLAIFALVFLSSFKTHAQDDSSYFDLQDDTQVSQPADTAPQEPPYTGAQDDEFQDVTNPPAQQDQSTKQVQEEEPQIQQQKIQENYEKKSTYHENYDRGPLVENPNKWKPYSRVPEENQLKSLADKDGLFRITKKGEYDYTYPTGPQHNAASFRVGIISFPNLENSQGTTFQQIYGAGQKPMIAADYEWQFFQSAGKLGLKFGSGLMVASGHGQFANAVPTPSGTTTDAEEKYNFFLFPNSLSLVYRLDVFPHQWFVPFAEGGADYFTFFELRDDAHGLHFGGSALAHFAVGGSFLLDAIDRAAAAGLNQEYGINHMWLTAEYRRFQRISGALDFSDNFIDAGILIEF